MKETVSIIIPVHNSSKYLKKCIDSILNQTYKNIEVIAVENGSTDNSIEILKSYKGKIKIEVLDNASIGSARNKGLDVSKGTYISFIDSDDYVSNDFIEVMLNKIKEDNSDLSICDMLEIHEETKERLKRAYYPSKKIEREEIKKNFVNFNYGPCNKLFKKEIILKNKLKFPENLKYEDIPFVLGYINNCKVISKVNEPLYNYNIHKESEQTTVNERIFDIFEIINLAKHEANIIELEELFTKILTTYSSKMRYVKDKEMRKKFIKKAYDYLDEEYDEDWRDNKYIKSLPIPKRIIQMSKILNTWYTGIYAKKH